MSRLLNDVGLSHYDEKIKEYIDSRPAVDSIFTRAANTTPETVPTRLQFSLLDIFGEDKIDNEYNGKIKIPLDGSDYEAELDLWNKFKYQGFDVNRINSAILVAYNRNIIYMEGATLRSASSLYEFDKAILVQRDYNQSKRLFHYMAGQYLYASNSVERQFASTNFPDPYGKTYAQTDGSLCGYLLSSVPDDNCKPVDPFTGLTNVFLKCVYLKTKEVGLESHTCLCFTFGHFDISTNPYLESKALVSTQGPSSENPFTLLLNPADFEG